MVSVTVAEPRFTPRERDLLLAARREANAPRGRHGVLLSAATDPALQSEWEVEPVTDFVQRKINAEQEKYEQYREVMDLGSLIWLAKPRGT